MRVIAGIYKGRTLKSITGRDIRPTTDNVRESIFNILAVRFEGANVLDLFGGTGALGIEALSRGAASVTFVDKARTSCQVINDNLNLVKAQARVINADADVALDRLTDKFDIIFIDPPYAMDGEQYISKISDKRLLSDGGIIVYERSAKDEASETIGDLTVTDTRKYGSVKLFFYQWKSV